MFFSSSWRIEAALSLQTPKQRWSRSWNCASSVLIFCWLS